MSDYTKIIQNIVSQSELHNKEKKAIELMNREEKISVLGSRYNSILEKVFEGLSESEKSVVLYDIKENDIERLLLIKNFNIKDINNIVLFLNVVSDSQFSGNEDDFKMRKAKFVFNTLIKLLNYINIDYLNILKSKKEIDIYKEYIKDTYFYYEKLYFFNNDIKSKVLYDLTVTIHSKLKSKGVVSTDVQIDISKYLVSENFLDSLISLKLFNKKYCEETISNRLDNLINNLVNVSDENDVRVDFSVNELKNDSADLNDLYISKLKSSNEWKYMFKVLSISMRESKKLKNNLEGVLKIEEKNSNKLYKIIVDILSEIDKENLIKSELLKLKVSIDSKAEASFLNYCKNYFSFIEKEFIAKEISISLTNYFEEKEIDIFSELKEGNNKQIFKKYIKKLVLNEHYNDSGMYYQIRETDLLNYERLYSNFPSELVSYYEKTNFKLLSNKKFIDLKLKSYSDSYKFVFFGLNYLNEDYVKFLKSISKDNLLKNYLDVIIDATYKRKSLIENDLSTIDYSSILNGNKKLSLDDKLETYVLYKESLNNVSHIKNWFNIKNDEGIEDSKEISTGIVKLYQNECIELLKVIPEDKDVERLNRFKRYVRKCQIDSLLYANSNTTVVSKNETDIVNKISSLSHFIKFDTKNRYLSISIDDSSEFLIGYRFIILKELDTETKSIKLKLLYKTPSDFSTFKGILYGMTNLNSEVFDKSLKIKSNSINSVNYNNKFDYVNYKEKIKCIFYIIQNSWDLRKSVISEDELISLEKEVKFSLPSIK